MTTERAIRRGRVLALPLLILASVTARALTLVPPEDQLHQMRQFSGTEDAVTRLLGSLGIEYVSDTAYFFVVPPMNAARIEGGINPFISLLRKAGVKADIVTMAVHNRPRAAWTYLQRRAFASDHSVVVNDSFMKPFALSSGDLRVPFAAKFCVRTGEMLSAYSLMGSIDSATIAWFIADTSRPRAEPPPAASHAPARSRRAARPGIIRQVLLRDNDSFPLSTCFYAALNKAGTNLALNDDLSGQVYVFDLPSGALANVIGTGADEETLFTHIPAQVFAWLKRNNVINSMYFGLDYCDDTTLLISASLPSVECTVTGTDTNYEYRNAPCVVSKQALTGRLISCSRLQHLPDSIRGGASITAVSFIPEASKAFLPFYKGWPSGGQMLSDSTPTEDNPFSDEFYRVNTYQFAVYNLTGEFAGLWGRLNARFRELRLGYFAGGGLVRHHDGLFYLSDQFSGMIRVHDSGGEPIDSLRFTDDPAPVTPPVDRERDPLHHLMEAARLNLNIRVIDFAVSNSTCAVLYLQDKRPTFCRLNIRSRQARRWALPDTYDGKTVKYYLVRDTPSGIVAASLLESGDQTYYCEFEMPGRR